MNGARSPACSMSQRWSSSKAVLKTSFSSSLRKSRCCTEPWLTVIEVHTSSLLRPFSSSSAARCLLRTLKEPDRVLWVKEFAAIGSMPGEAPPQMIEIEAVGAIANLLEKRSEEHTSELQSLLRISYAVFCLQKNNTQQEHKN